MEALTLIFTVYAGVLLSLLFFKKKPAQETLDPEEEAYRKREEKQFLELLQYGLERKHDD